MVVNHLRVLGIEAGSFARAASALANEESLQHPQCLIYFYQTSALTPEPQGNINDLFLTWGLGESIGSYAFFHSVPLVFLHNYGTIVKTNLQALVHCH